MVIIETPVASSPFEAMDAFAKRSGSSDQVETDSGYIPEPAQAGYRNSGISGSFNNPLNKNQIANQNTKQSPKIAKKQKKMNRRIASKSKKKGKAARHRSNRDSY